MAFLIPEYIHDIFVDVNDGTDILPQEYYLPDMGDIENVYELAYWCRLSAPGYMDCTDWAGPFDTLHEAKVYMYEWWEVDPETGDDLPDDAPNTYDEYVALENNE